MTNFCELECTLPNSNHFKVHVCKLLCGKSFVAIIDVCWFTAATRKCQNLLFTAIKRLWLVCSHHSMKNNQLDCMIRSFWIGLWFPPKHLLMHWSLISGTKNRYPYNDLLNVQTNLLLFHAQTNTTKENDHCNRRAWMPGTPQITIKTKTQWMVVDFDTIVCQLNW